MRAKLRPGGLLLISVRDYDRALIERPVTATPRIHPGPPRKVLVRLHDRDGPNSQFYTVQFLILTEDGQMGWTVEHHSGRYRAVGRMTLTRAAEDAGFTHVTWYAGEEVRFHQPVMTALSVERNVQGSNGRLE